MSKVRPQARKGGAVLLSTGVVLTVLSLFVGPANASGESTTATLTSPASGTATTFVWSYQFNQNGGHSLSNIAIRFCDDSLLGHVVSAGPNATVQSGGVTGGHTGFGPGIRFDTHDPSGSLTVTFDQAYAIAPQALEIESHSGDGQLGDVITTAAGPAAECATDPTTTTTVVDEPTTTTVVDDPTTTTVVVLGDTITAADGASGEALARTGSNVRAQLALAGLALTLGGVAMAFGERKQRALAR